VHGETISLILIMRRIILFFAASALVVSAAPDGKLLFTNNCSACHLPDQMVVGPSLVEIRTLYLGKPDDFLKWCVAPQKKRPNAIDMPSMVHVGDEGLRAIYTHVMKVSEGVKEVKAKAGDPYVTSPVQMKRPQIQRIFMPNAGPAAIAVALDNQVSLCWDAGECRLRYAWNGGFIDGYPYWQGNGSSLAKVLGNVRYTEKASPFKISGEVKFSGYKVEKGLPVFQYQLGDKKITESFAALPNGSGFSRTFTLSPAPTVPLELDFSTDEKVAYSSDKGTWAGSKLTLTAAEASTFTINHSFK
jgi:cytochrome c551/c552